MGKWGTVVIFQRPKTLRSTSSTKAPEYGGCETLRLLPPKESIILIDWTITLKTCTARPHPRNTGKLGGCTPLP